MRATLISVVLVIAACGGGGPTGDDTGDDAPPDPSTCEHDGNPNLSGGCCRDDVDCTATQEFCAPPGTAPGCGVCFMDPGDCTTDAECEARGAGMICEPITCACFDQRSCVPGCTDDSTCAEGETCDVAAGRCVATPCTTAAQCPTDFSCATDACARTTCTTDAECDGFCVLGRCYPSSGECQLPAA